MARQWYVEKHDQDDGSITWEIWEKSGSRICGINDHGDQSARTNAHMIADHHNIVMGLGPYTEQPEMKQLLQRLQNK